MSVHPVSGNTQTAAPEAAAKPQPPKPQAALPQDTVTLSAAATKQAAPSSGDVDRDGDSH